MLEFMATSAAMSDHSLRSSDTVSAEFACRMGVLGVRVPDAAAHVGFLAQRLLVVYKWDAAAIVSEHHVVLVRLGAV